MSVKNSNKVFVKLVALSKQAEASMYDRITLAKQLLEDREWVEAATGGGGDENTAIDRLEAKCFYNTGMSLPQMIQLLETVPEKEAWDACGHNLRRMWAEKAERETPAPTIRESREEARAKEDKPAPSLTPREDKLKKALQDKDNYIIVLRQQLMEARQEIGKLKDQNRRMRKELEKINKIMFGGDEMAGESTPH